MSAIKLTGLMKVNFGGSKGISLKEYYEAKAKALRIDNEKGIQAVKLAAQLAFKEGFELPEEYNAKQRENAKKLAMSIRKDLEASAKEREDEKVAKEKEKAEAEKRAKELEEKTKLALAKAEKAVLPKVNDALTSGASNAEKYLGKKFHVVNGNLTADDGLTDADFAQGFAGIKALVDTTETLAKNFAKLEAQMALLAEKQYGEDWPNFLQSSSERIPIIKKNMAALKLSSQLGIELTTEAGDIPIGVARALLEAKISSGEKDSDKKNLDFKKETLEEFINLSNEKGRVLTANEARNLVNERKNARLGDGASKVQFSILYVFSDKGTTRFIPSKDKKPDLAILAKAAFAVDRALNVMRVVGKDLKVFPAAIPGDLEEFFAKLGVEVTPQKDSPAPEKPEATASVPATDSKPAPKQKAALGPKPEPKSDDDDDFSLDLDDDTASDADDSESDDDSSDDYSITIDDD